MPESPLSRAELARIRSLKQRKARDKERKFLAEGIRVVEALLATDVVLDLALVAPSLGDTARGRQLVRDLAARTDVRPVSVATLRAVADAETPQGVVVVGQIPEARLPELPQDQGSVLLALDAVQDPGNFGTLVRSAEAFGVQGVIALPGTVDTWNAKAVRAAAGTSFGIPVVAMSVPQVVAFAAAGAYVLWGAAADGEDVRQVVRERRIVLVIGNEGAGIGAEMTSHLQRRVSVPIRGSAESLNAAMAGTVLLHMLTAEPPILQLASNRG